MILNFQIDIPELSYEIKIKKMSAMEVATLLTGDGVESQAYVVKSGKHPSVGKPNDFKSIKRTSLLYSF